MKRSIIMGALALGLMCSSAVAATIVYPTQSGSVDVSGTVTVGGTYQSVQDYNSNRRNCTIQNPANATEVLSIKLGTMAQPFVLSPGQTFSTLNATIGATDAITLTAATTSHAFAGTCQQ
jgi:hypothetical protein